MRYTDQRLTSDQFADVRDKLPYGQLPVAKIDGVNVSQSMAIARWVKILNYKRLCPPSVCHVLSFHHF